jgi:putative solute:sodium symporter small subunit
MAHTPTSRNAEPVDELLTTRARAPLWGCNVRLILLLLALWAVLSFVPAWFARTLMFPVAGWPFAYWMAAYGAPLAYLVIIVAYALIMNGADEDE